MARHHRFRDDGLQSVDVLDYLKNGLRLADEKKVVELCLNLGQVLVTINAEAQDPHLTRQIDRLVIIVITVLLIHIIEAMLEKQLVVLV